jgi:3-hydroxyisobutyrate dehydrogenase
MFLQRRLLLRSRPMIHKGIQQCLGGNRYLSSSVSDDATVGFLGLGNMGYPMSINLGKSKKVIVYDLNESALAKANEQGIASTDSIEQMAANASTFVTMLPGDAAVDAVMKQILGNCRENSTIIDCSTVSPTTSRYWNDLFGAEGHLFVDAPVSGGVKGAENATLTFMVGSDDNTLKQRIQPILECMGQRIIACGGPGAGAVVKLCNNLALAAQMVGICEAMNLGEALGVDPTVLADVMNTSTAKSWSCEVNNPHPTVAARANSPASKDYVGGFGSRLMLKDLGLAVAAGSEAHVALPLGNVTKELYQLAEARGLGDKDFGVILQFLRGK